MVPFRGVDALRNPAVAFTLAVAVGVATWAVTPDPATGRMLGVTLFCIVLWVLTPVPPAYTGVLAIGLVAVLFETELALSGFQSPATWLIGFGLLMGEATRRSGLASLAGERITARALRGTRGAARVREGGDVDALRAYRRLLLALGLAAHALALLVPSALVRVLLLAPILKEAGELFDSRSARVGVFLGPLFATFYGSSGILTADLPNIIITGLAASIANHHVAWSEWALLMYPVMGLTRVLLVIAVVYLLLRPDADGSVSVPERNPSAFGPTERRMLAFLLVGVVVWTTDFVHGFHPVVGAVAVVVLAFLPGIGVTEFEDAGEVDFSVLFFIAAVLAIGNGMASTGFADIAASRLFGVVPSDASLAVVLAVTFLVTLLLALLMEGLAVASVLTPVLVPYAEAAGVPLTPVLMTEALALSNYFFPYQSAVLVAILAEGVVDAQELIRTTVLCTLATICLLLPLQIALFTVVF